MELVNYNNMRLIDYRNEIRDLKRRKKTCEELKETYYRKCFEFFDLANGDRDKLNEISKQQGIAVITICEYAYLYASKNLCYTKEDLDSIYGYSLNLENIKDMKRDVFPTDINNLFLDLMVEENEEKIIELIKNRYGNSYSCNLKLRVSNFVIAYFPSKKDYLIDSLRKKIDIYRDYIKEQNDLILEEERKEELKNKELEEQRFYNDTKIFLESFIAGDFANKLEFCQKNNLKMEILDKIIELSEKYDPKNCQKYKDKIDNQRNRRFAIIIGLIYKIINYLKNGIEYIDGSIKSFDIIDYYLLTKLDFDFLLKTINEFNVKLSIDEYKILKTFFAKNKNATKDNFKDIAKILNPDSIQIVGNRTILIEEKQLIVKYLKDNKIPQNIVTYNLCLRRYLDCNLKTNTKDNIKVRKLSSI